MSKHTSLLGYSKVAKLWQAAYRRCQVGDPFDKVVKIAGRPDETLNLGETILYTSSSREWKGWLRGGYITRKMQFVVKEGIIISKTADNLERMAW